MASIIQNSNVDLNRKKTSQKLPLTADWWKRDLTKLEYHKQTTILTSELHEEPEQLSAAGDVGKIERTDTLELDGKITLDWEEKILKQERINKRYDVICDRTGITCNARLVKLLEKLAKDVEQVPADSPEASNVEMDPVTFAYYGFTKQAATLAFSALWGFSRCTYLDIRGNTLTPKPTKVLIRMLHDSQIKYLNMSNTNLSGFGSKLLAPWISSSKYIQTLIMADNYFNDQDGRLLFEALSSNRSLHRLDLSGNKFYMRCGHELKSMLEENDILEDLDLSWNNLRMFGAFSIAQGIRKNTGLKKLNLAWNGFSDAGCQELGRYLSENETLECVDLTSNRIGDIGLAHLANGLANNRFIHQLSLGYNVISQMALHTILEGLYEEGGLLLESGLMDLNLKGSYFETKKLEEELTKVKKLRPNFQCSYSLGSTLSVHSMPIKPTNTVTEAITALTSFLNGKCWTLTELFESLVEDPDVPRDFSQGVSYQEFRVGLQKAGVPVSESQIERLINYMDVDGDGQIDFSELAIGTEKNIQIPSNEEELIVDDDN